MTNILVVEDNARLRNMMALGLRQTGFHVYEAGHGEEALEILDKVDISLMVVDVMMPVMDGFTLTDTLRKADDSTPVLMITSKETLEDKRRGFKLGADAYLVKPVQTEEMVLYVEALLRRAQIAQSHTLIVGATTLDEDSMTTKCGEKIVVLPQKEFLLLQMLLSYPAKIFTRQDLMDKIWGYESDSDPRTVDVHIKRIREKYWNSEDFEIETVRGLGYRAVYKYEKD